MGEEWKKRFLFKYIVFDRFDGEVYHFTCLSIFLQLLHKNICSYVFNFVSFLARAL